ncbi:MAG TPA: caspase family protein [Tepidisphaeraceae bacterium]|jgi:hypothetical protein|nr:caspase family protein [Tepidisphaeraceae bacterium]
MPKLLYAILVGIDKYQVSRIGNLQTAVRDVRAMERFIHERLDFDEVHCDILTGDRDGRGEKLATVNNIINTFEVYSNLGMQPDDAFLFYFAGHGIEQAGEHFLLGCDSPYDRELRKLRKAALDLQEVRSMCSLLGAGQQIIILDACRNNPTVGARSLDGSPGAVVTRGLAFEPVEEGVAVRGHETRRAWISACGPGQCSFEYAAAGNSWFCHNLLGELNEESGPEIALPLLIDRVTARMKNASRRDYREASEQLPVLICDEQPVVLPLRPPRMGGSRTPAPVFRDEPRSEAPVADSADWAGIVDLMVVSPAEPVRGDEDAVRQYHADCADLARIEALVGSVENGTHPPVKEALSALGRLQRSLVQSSDEVHGLRRELGDAVARTLEANPFTRPSELRALVGDARVNVALQFLDASLRMRNDTARLSASKTSFNEKRDDIVRKLQARRDEIAARVNHFLRHDIDRAMADLQPNASADAGFPLTALLGALPRLKHRYAPMTGEQILDIAEEVYNARHPVTPPPAQPAAERAAVFVEPRALTNGDVRRVALTRSIAAAAIGADGRIYVGGRDGVVQSLSYDHVGKPRCLNEPIDGLLVCGDSFLIQRPGRVTAVEINGDARVDMTDLRGQKLLCAGEEGRAVLTARGSSLQAYRVDPAKERDPRQWLSQPRGLASHRGAITSASMNAAGVVSAGRDGDVRCTLFDAGFRHWPRPFELGVSVNAVALSPDGSRIAVAGKRNRLNVLNAGDGSVVYSATLAGRFLTGVCYFDAGRLLAVGDDAGVLTVLRAADGANLWSEPLNAGGATSDGGVIALAGGAEGTELVAIGADGAVLMFPKLARAR